MTDRAAGALAYIVGQDAEGHWLAVEIHGCGGGLFRDQEAAVRFASFETQHRPEAVRLSPQPLCLVFRPAEPSSASRS